MNPRGVPIDDLLIHAEFVRSLARDLVRDPHAAEDLAQDAWVNTLQKPPAHGAALRGWFATLLQNLWRNRGRGERRRAGREAGAPPPDAMPSPAQILEREQVRERLVRAVLRLDEPFRTAVLLRYYEDQPAATIAQRLGVPAATVRTRLARGIARLREMLDEQHGGSRAWLAPMSTWVAGMGGEAAAVIVAGIAMKKILFAAAAVAAFAIAWAVSSGDESAPQAPSPVVGSTVAAAALPSEMPIAPQREAGAAASAVPEAAPLPVFPCERGVGVVLGDVVDENDEPVAGVEVIAEPVIGTLPPRFQLRDDRSRGVNARTDVAGRFRIDGVVSGPVRVRTVVADTRRAEAHTTVAPGATEGPLLLRMRWADPGDWVRIAVVDGDGRPVSDVPVELYGWSSSEAFASRPTDPRTDPVARTITDENGIAELRLFAIRAAVVFARAGALVGRAEFDTSAQNFEGSVAVRVVLQSPGSLHGTLAGAGDEPLDGTIVSLHAQPQLAAYYPGGGRRFEARVTGRAFRFEALPAGHYSVTLSSPQGARLVVEPMSWGTETIPNSASLRIVTVVTGARTDIEIPVAAGGRLRGTVRGDGRPIAGARIRAVLVPHSANHAPGFVMRGVHVWHFEQGWEGAPNEPLTHVEGKTDAAGSYELRSLLPGKYRVEVVANGLSYDRRMEVVVEEGAATELRHDLVAAGVLQFAALGLTYVGVTRVGATTPAMLAITDREFVTFPGLAPGRYEIARFHSDLHVEPVVLATAEVFAGRTTWVDLRQPVAVVTGRVTAGGAPVAGARVSFDLVHRRTDAFGAFRLELGYRPVFELDAAVSRNGVEAVFMLPALEDAVLELGRRHVTIGAVDEKGVPVPASLDLRAFDGNKPATGLQFCSITSKLLAGPPTRIGPLPDWLLHGDVVFENGVRVSISMFPGTDAMTVTRPPIGTVRVQVRNPEGTPAEGVTIDATTWRGEGEPPQDDDAFREGEGRSFRTAVTGENGIAEFAVVAGEVMVAVWGSSVRATVAPGATVTTAPLTMQ